MATTRNAQDQIARRYFGPTTRRNLAAFGIRVTGITLIPDGDGFANGRTAYTVDDNGCHRVLTLGQVLALAE